MNVQTHTKNHVVNNGNHYQRTEVQSTHQLNIIANDNELKNISSNTYIYSSSDIIDDHNNKSIPTTRPKRMNSDCICSTAVAIIRQPIDSFVGGLSVSFNIDSLCSAAVFGISRGFLNPEDMINHQENTSCACNSLYIISWHGRLIEYVLEPIPG